MNANLCVPTHRNVSFNKATVLFPAAQQLRQNMPQPFTLTFMCQAQMLWLFIYQKLRYIFLQTTSIVFSRGSELFHFSLGFINKSLELPDFFPISLLLSLSKTQPSCMFAFLLSVRSLLPTLLSLRMRETRGNREICMDSRRLALSTTAIVSRLSERREGRRERAGYINEIAIMVRSTKVIK